MDIISRCCENRKDRLSPVERLISERTGIYSAGELQRFQLEKAWESAAYAAERSEFYRGYLSAASFGGDYERWLSVPFLMPEDLADTEKLCAVSRNDVARIVELQTSGTERKKKIFFTEEDIESTVDFFAAGMSAMAREGQTVAVFMRGEETYTIGWMLKEGLARIGVSCVAVWPVSSCAEAAKAARSCGCFIGTPHFMLRLALAYPSLCPESVLLSADFVPESVIKRVEDIWNCRTLTHYGMTEMCYGGGVQCLEKDACHFRDEDFLIEIIEPGTNLPVKSGEAGEVVVTTLKRRAVPLIRYKTGDIAKTVSGPCRCGGVFPKIEKVLGRYENRVRLRSGQETDISRLDESLFSVREIFDYRVHKTAGGGLRFDVFVSDRSGEKAAADAINGLFRQDDVQIGFRREAFDLDFRKRVIETG